MMFQPVDQDDNNDDNAGDASKNLKRLFRCGQGHRLVPNVAVAGLHQRCNNPACPAHTEGSPNLPEGSVYVGCLLCNFNLCYDCALDRVGAEKPAVNAEVLEVEEEENASLLPVSTTQHALDAILKTYKFTYPTLQNSAVTTTEPVLCKRRETIDLYSLLSQMLARFGLQCTNSSDATAVGLLALRNGLQCIKTDKISNHSGSLCTKCMLSYMQGGIETALQHLSKRLMDNDSVKSFLVTFTIQAPRWVLLDLSNTCFMMGDPFCNGKALDYLARNPDAISFDLDPDNALATVPVKFCPLDEKNKCNSIWTSCCHHRERQPTVLVKRSSSMVNADLMDQELIRVSASDGTIEKIPVVVLRPNIFTLLKEADEAPLHCQSCLMRTQSLKEARLNHSACHYGIKAGRGSNLIPLCSARLCSLYFDDSKAPLNAL